MISSWPISTNPKSIGGAAQTADHLRNGENLYVAPFFFAISTAYLKELNYPDMNATAYMDVGQNLTEQVIKNERTVRCWWPTEIEEEKWRLNHHEHNKFGLGTPTTMLYILLSFLFIICSHGF